MAKITFRLFWSVSILLLLAAIPYFGQKPGETKPATDQTAAYQPSQIELEIFAEVNKVRQNPRNYAKFLKKLRDGLKDNTIRLPDGRMVQMSEGVSALDDAIAFLNKKEKLPLLGFSNGLSQTARMQLTDLQENIQLGHFGKDRSSLELRLLRIGFPGKEQAENISYHATTAEQIVLNMILDENKKERPHRENIFSTRFNQIGISYGLSTKDVALCVMVFNNNFREHKNRGGAIPVL